MTKSLDLQLLYRDPVPKLFNKSGFRDVDPRKVLENTCLRAMQKPCLKKLYFGRLCGGIMHQISPIKTGYDCTVRIEKNVLEPRSDRPRILVQKTNITTQHPSKF